MNASRFRKVMNWVLSEGPGPDEPGLEPDEHLGQWVLPDKRGLGEIEDDTELEKKLWDALVSHYMDPGGLRLGDIWDELMQLSRAGLYKDWLQPPTGPVYRGMTLSVEDASRLLGIPEDEITDNDWHSTEDAMVQSAGGTLPPMMDTSSWTTKVDIAEEFIPLYVGSVLIIFRAQCAPNGAGGGEFLMNPDQVPDEFPHIGNAEAFTSGRLLSDEEEVVANGPVRWDRAAWVYIAPPNSVVWQSSEAKTIRNKLRQAAR